jgi:hypothetical protein
MSPHFQIPVVAKNFVFITSSPNHMRVKTFITSSNHMGAKNFVFTISSPKHVCAKTFITSSNHVGAKNFLRHLFS